MRGDLTVCGPQTSISVRSSASATRWEAGEPLHSVATSSSGASSANVYVLAAADTPVIGTHKFGGVALKGALPAVTGTLVAQKMHIARPVAWAGVIRGKAETAGSVDTASELLGIIQDVTLIDYAATGGTDGGELYTIKESASADTSGLEIVDGNIFKGTLDVMIDGRAYRSDVS